MSVAAPAPLLDEANAAFVQGGVSVVAASRDAALVPTHRTLQLKADRARVRAVRKAEVSIVERYVAAFASEIEPLGHTTEQARTLLECHEDDLVAVDFVPSAAFEQTPGPRAGAPLPTTR